MIEEKMNAHAVRVLIVEDNPADARLIVESLRGSSGRNFEPRIATSLAEAFSEVQTAHCDVTLLDLSLPDSDGLQTLEAFMERLPDLPVVVSTGNNDEQLGLQAVSLGASDFLPKNEASSLALNRCLTYAIERRRLIVEREAARRMALESQELAQLSGLATDTLDLDASGGSRSGFRERRPEQFERVRDIYRGIAGDALAEQRHQIDSDVSGRLRQVAELLGGWQCGPGDVVDVHVAAIEQGGDTRADRLRAAEVRFLLIELLGYLVSYYRGLAVYRQNGSPPERSPDAA